MNVKKVAAAAAEMTREMQQQKKAETAVAKWSSQQGGESGRSRVTTPIPAQEKGQKAAASGTQTEDKGKGAATSSPVREGGGPVVIAPFQKDKGKELVTVALLQKDMGKEPLVGVPLERRITLAEERTGEGAPSGDRERGASPSESRPSKRHRVDEVLHRPQWDIYTSSRVSSSGELARDFWTKGRTPAEAAWLKDCTDESLAGIIFKSCVSVGGAAVEVDRRRRVSERQLRDANHALEDLRRKYTDALALIEASGKENRRLKVDLGKVSGELDIAVRARGQEIPVAIKKATEQSRLREQELEAKLTELRRQREEELGEAMRQLGRLKEELAESRRLREHEAKQAEEKLSAAICQIEREKDEKEAAVLHARRQATEEAVLDFKASEEGIQWCQFMGAAALGEAVHLAVDWMNSRMPGFDWTGFPLDVGDLPDPEVQGRSDDVALGLERSPRPEEGAGIGPPVEELPSGIVPAGDPPAAGVPAGDVFGEDRERIATGGDPGEGKGRGQD